MFKLTSIILIFSAGFLVSLEYVNEYKKKKMFIQGCIGTVNYICDTIMYQQQFLGELFIKGARYGKNAEKFFIEIGELMEEKISAKEAFNKVSEKEFYGNKNVLSILSEYFEEAGMFETETEYKRIKLLSERLKNAEQEEENYIRNTVNQNRKIILAITVLLCVFVI